MPWVWHQLPPNNRADEQLDFLGSQQVVCFTETPLEHVWMMCEEIDDRQTSLAPYGLAFTKTWGRKKGINPVWYLDISARGIDWLTNPVNRIVNGALAQNDYGHDIFRLTPFIEQMGPTKGARKEWWWEREWRLAARDLTFSPREIVTVLAPANQHLLLRLELDTMRKKQGFVEGYFASLKFIDPRWGLERIIARLAGVPDDQAGPLPRS